MVKQKLTVSTVGPKGSTSSRSHNGQSAAKLIDDSRSRYEKVQRLGSPT